MLSSIPSSDALNPDPKPSSPSSSEVIPQLGKPSSPSPSEVIPQSGTSSDLDLHVALRKATRSCTTRHPINNVVSYSHLSPIYQTFISNLTTECIPKHVSEALTHPKWREAMLEEMTALTWDLTTLLEGKQLLDASGSSH